MPANRFSLTGQWSGEFSYPRHIGPTTPFLARIEDRSGRLTGSIIEPDTVSGGPTIEAILSGSRHESGVDFTKVYGPPWPFGYEEPVDYVGQVSSDGNTISGVWSMLDLDGTFEMRREPDAAEAIGDEESIVLPEPTPMPIQ